MSESQQQIVVRLTEAEDALWRQFAAHTSEMITTKPGRKFFPKLQYTIEGLDTEKMYTMALEIHQVDDNFHHFSGCKWSTTGRSEVSKDETNRTARELWHLDDVMTGEQWMANPVNFDHVRLSSNRNSDTGSCVFVRSMHKYVPVLKIYELASISVFPYLTSKPIAVIGIEHTKFIGVTKYQNKSLASLKKASINYAIEFYKRPRSSSPSLSQPKFSLPTIHLHHFTPNSFMQQKEQEVVVRLTEQSDALWRQFARHINEMLVTKKGKEISPSLEYHIEGLDAKKMYEMAFEIHQVDDYQYHNLPINNKWTIFERSKQQNSVEFNRKTKKFWHLDRVKTGEEWMANPVNFDSVLLSSNQKNNNKASYIFLHTMHKYVPVLSIYEAAFGRLNVNSEPIAVAKIKYTEFILVTNYQNETVRSLKAAIKTPINRKRFFSNCDEIISPTPKKPTLDVASPATGILPNPAMLTYAPNPFTLHYFAMMGAAPYFGGFAGANPNYTPTTSFDSSSVNSEKYGYSTH